MKQKLVVVGNGMAALRTLEELIDIAPDRHDILVFGAERLAGYNRILLSSVLSGDKELEQIITHPTEWFDQHGIATRLGVPVTGIDRQAKRVVDAKGQSHAYDRLILATGSHPIILPLPGRELPGVVPFRDANDVERMLKVAQKGGKAVVIGGGLLGLEAAMGLMQRGMTVTVVHLMENLMERQLDGDAAAMLRGELAARGLRFRMPVESAAILGTERVTGLQLKNGETLPADLVVMAVGIRPNVDLARQADLAIRRGILVDDLLNSSDPDIFAVGECVEHRGVVHGLVAPLFAQAKVLARHLAGVATEGYAGSTVSTRLKVTGVEVFSAGEIHGTTEDDILLYQDPARRIHKKLVVRDNRIQGVVMLGDTREGPWLMDLMRDQADIAPMRDHILFGPQEAGAGETDAAALPDSHEICGCNGVTKGSIVGAIQSKGLSTLDEVRAHTKASASCGSCTRKVEQILVATLGSGYVAPTKKPLCGCTPLSSDEVRQAVRDGMAGTVSETMQRLGWSQPDGCPTCRQAVNYYLTVFHPDPNREEPAARFVNERFHANIQKDGTYSVVPRIFGGVTAAQELRVIADLVDRFAIPEVKFTGGQRLTLLGIRREQLPDVWHELASHGLVSGHAYGKAVRTVKTCVGDKWCRFGTQDSEGMGIILEKQVWNSWTPHKVKLAVSGCPRNCAEATIKDIGIIAVESGWEIHVGGNGGIEVRVTDLLAKVTTMEEVSEWSMAFLQLYRREARYLERTAPWVARTGIAAIRAILENPEERRRLAAAFRAAHENLADPWLANSRTDKVSRFKPLTLVEREQEMAA